MGDVNERKEKKTKNKNREYFIMNATSAFSSGDFSSDTTGGRLKVKGVNKLSKKGGDMKNVG